MSYGQHFRKMKTIANKKPSQKIKPKAKAAKPQMRGFVLGSISLLLVGVGSWVFLLGEEGVSRLLSRVEVNVFGLAEAKEENHAATNDEKAEKSAGKEAPAHHVEKAPSKSWTDEEISLFQKLESKKAELDIRQQKLQQLEEELQKQKVEIEEKIATMDQMRTQISQKLEGQVAVDEQKLQSLVSLYQNMKPAQAAKVIETLNEDLAVNILTKMKNKNAAEILNFMSSEKAKKLSEQYAGYKALADSK